MIEVNHIVERLEIFERGEKTGPSLFCFSLARGRAPAGRRDGAAPPGQGLFGQKGDLGFRDGETLRDRADRQIKRGWKGGGRSLLRIPHRPGEIMVREKMLKAGELRLVSDGDQHQMIPAEDIERADDLREGLSRSPQTERGKGADIEGEPPGPPLRPKGERF